MRKDYGMLGELGLEVGDVRKPPIKGAFFVKQGCRICIPIWCKIVAVLGTLAHEFEKHGASAYRGAVRLVAQSTINCSPAASGISFSTRIA